VTRAASAQWGPADGAGAVGQQYWVTTVPTDGSTLVARTRTDETQDAFLPALPGVGRD
jgi:hypothetical protein